VLIFDWTLPIEGALFQIMISRVRFDIRGDRAPVSLEANMPASKLITAVAIASPRCPKCGAQMSLVTISVRGEGNDERICECARCQHEITEVIKFKEAS
jgi:hypothetical protein